MKLIALPLKRRIRELRLFRTLFEGRITETGNKHKKAKYM